MNNKNFISTNDDCTYNIVTELNKATIFDNFASANHFLQNHIVKKIRYKYKIVNCDDLLLSDNLLSSITLNKVQSETVKIIDENIQMLSNALSLMDRKQQDILHYIESTEKFNLYESWKIVKKLKGIRSKRRKIKKSLTTLNSFKQSINLNSLYLEQCESSLYTNKVITDFSKYIISEEDEL